VIAPDEPPEGDVAPDAPEPRLTRTQQTRAAAAVNELGLELTRLRPQELDRLELPERVREAIDVSQRLKPRSRGRQNRLIGQLLRAEDHEAIRARLETLRGGHRLATRQEKLNERWLARIVEEGDPAVEALIVECPDADRQRLRVLARSARQDPEAAKTKRARRELLRTIRALRA
jgi:ribosome-associated protein